MTTKKATGVSRRGLLAGAGAMAAAPLVSRAYAQSSASQPVPARSAVSEVTQRRKLGSLEVSSVGLGVQNMSRTYQMTVPTRSEMHNIIRTAFDRGLTFYDAAEAYGPLEVERILGEGVEPFRDEIVIATKYGWNIDQETGERLPGPLTVARIISSWSSRAC